MARRCKYGKLKHPRGRRVCKQKRASRNPKQTAWRRARTQNNKMDRSFGRRRR